MSKLGIEPVSLAEAKAFVRQIHRHHQPPTGHKFSIALIDAESVRHGVAIIGRPSSRHLDDGRTLEATRVCTDGTPNACSALLGAAWRAARELGFRRLITYTQADESGASLRASGWRKTAELRPRAGWDTPTRRRGDSGHPTGVRRYRWEVVAHNYQPAELRHTDPDGRDETARRCAFCPGPVKAAVTGRPPAYCSHACRQAAYRDRKAVLR